MLSFCLSWGDKTDVTHGLPVAVSEAVAVDLFEIPSDLGFGNYWPPSGIWEAKPSNTLSVTNQTEMAQLSSLTLSISFYTTLGTLMPVALLVDSTRQAGSGWSCLRQEE